MNLLLHICCAPCANRPLEVLRQEGIQVTGYWYNPNIHPFTEYRSRRDTVRQFARDADLPLCERDEYGLRPFLRAVAGHMDARCAKCYEMRLMDTARHARENGFDAFTSSLFISPHQDLELLAKIGRIAAQTHGVEFLERDFRHLFQEGQSYAKSRHFYMQKFCGCIFSEQERYQKPEKIIP